MNLGYTEFFTAEELQNFAQAQGVSPIVKDKG
jgi:hypothetical protein